jgi:hypothetical protein
MSVVAFVQISHPSIGNQIATTRASVRVSTVIKVKSESNSTVIQSNQNRIGSSQPVTASKRISHPSIGMFVIRNQSQIRIKNDPATPASNTNNRYHGVKRVPCAVHNSDWYSADVESRQ